MRKIAVLSLILFLTACSSSSKIRKLQAASQAAQASSLIEIEKSFTCSMDGGHYSSAGHCPKCGMDLIEEKRR